MAGVDSLLGSIIGGLAIQQEQEANKPMTPLKDDGASAPKNDQQVVDPFAIVPQLRKANTEATSRAYKADEVLGKAMQTVDRVQNDRMADLSKTVEAKKGVNLEAAKTTGELLTASKPLFQKIKAISDRETELAEMNPLKRGVLGIFNANYNTERLGELKGQYQEQLRDYGSNYQTLMGLYDNAMKSINEAYEESDAVRQLEVENEVQDVQFANQSYGSAMQVIAAQSAGLQQNAEVARAQALAKDDILQSLTMEQANKAAAEAKSKGGEAVVNGVPLRLGEIQQVQMNWQQKMMSLESMKLSLQANRLQLADAHMDNFISKMTGPELDAAIRNGGVLPDGTKLDQLKLTQAMGSMAQRRALQAEQASNQSVDGVYRQVFNSIANNVNQSRKNTSTLFGVMPKELEQQNQAIVSKLTGFNEGYQKAKAGGYESEFHASKMKELEEIQNAQITLQRKLAERWAGGDKDIAALASGLMVGDPVNNEQTARGLIKLVRKGIPAGTKLSPEANAMMQKVRATVSAAEANNKKPGLDVKSMFSKNGDIDQALVQQVMKVTQDSYASTMIETVIQSSPTLAKQIGHEFAQVSNDDMATAMVIGDKKGMEAFARKYGISDKEASALFSPPATQEQANMRQNAMNKIRNKNPEANEATLGRQLAAAQTSQMLIALDASPSAKQGFKPSVAFTSLMSNPKYQQMAENYAQANSGRSLGDFAAYQIGNSRYSEALYNQVGLTQQAQAANQQARMEQNIADNNKLRNRSPIESARFALHANPNLTDSDVEKLVAALVPATRTYIKSQGADAAFTNPGDAIDAVIMNQQFQDPNLEKIRRTAAKDWMANRKDVHKGLEGFLRYTQEAIMGDSHQINGNDPLYKRNQ